MHFHEGLILLLAVVLLPEISLAEGNERVDEVYIPPNILDEVEPTRKETIILTSQSKGYVKSGYLFLPRRELAESFSHDENGSLKKQGPFSSLWSQWSCCRTNTDRQARIKMSQISGFGNIEHRYCSTDYCPGQQCYDQRSGLCSYLSQRGGCYRLSHYYGYMVRSCPRTCGWCYRPTYTEPPTPPTPPPTPPTPPPPSTPSPSATVKVRAYFSEDDSIRRYKYSVYESPGYSFQEEERDYFYLYRRPYELFSTPVYFCIDETNDVEVILKQPCENEYLKTKYTFYAARNQVAGATFVLISTITQQFNNNAVRMSRAFQFGFCCGYNSVSGIIFAPRRSIIEATTTVPPTTTKPFNLFSRFTPPTPPATVDPYRPPPYPTTTIYRPPFPQTTTPLNLFSRFTPPTPPATVDPYRPPPYPTTTIYRPPLPTTYPVPFPTIGPQGNGAAGAFGSKCLAAHNYLRAQHNTPALEWDQSLYAQAKRWAEYLVLVAPREPSQGNGRTRNWPHSDAPSSYRERGVGENIMWELMDGESDAEMTPIRWYAEIFDFSWNNPLQGKNNKPVGHYAQVLWKDSKKMGCAIASKTVNRNGYDYTTNYVVAHYSPGTIYDPRSSQNTEQIFRRNVLDSKQGSCQARCSDEFNCIGYGSGMSCVCNGSTAPRCTGYGGCIARCDPPNGLRYSHYRDTCKGETSCICSNTPVNGITGAICS